MTPDVLLVVLCGAVVGGALVLLVAALRGREPQPARPPGLGSLSALSGRLLADEAAKRFGPAVAAALIVGILTRWPVLAVAAGALAFSWPSLFGGGGASKRSMLQLEALASWTESLRDTIAGAAGLEAAIPVSVDTTGEAIRPHVGKLADRLHAREPMVDALRKFGDDLDDASADLIVAALVLNARLRGAGLVNVLGALSVSAREELDMRRRVDASRRSTQRGVQVIVVVTVLVAGLLVVFNRPYVEPYSTALGQVVLAGIVVLFGFGFWWLRRLSEFDLPERFLAGADEVSGSRTAGSNRLAASPGATAAASGPPPPARGYEPSGVQT